jgi:hypothetical protein
MKKIIFLLIINLGLHFSLQAQGIMNLPLETYDFGTIEEGTIATYEFEFTNTGDQPIEISSVKASCGCTAPDWSKTAIFPNKKGKIKASFDSNGRPGPFMKSLTVISNAQKSNIVLYIKGFVKGKENTQGANYLAGNEKTMAPPQINIDYYNFDFGKVEMGEKAKQRFIIQNSGETPLIIKALDSACKCIGFGLSNGTIAPGGREILELSINTDKIQKINEIFQIESNDPKKPLTEIKLSAEIYSNFGKSMFKEKKTSAPFEE